jgi:hypothetical protein
VRQPHATDLSSDEIWAVIAASTRIREFRAAHNRYLKAGRATLQVKTGRPQSEWGNVEPPVAPIIELVSAGLIDRRREAALCSLAYVYAAREISHLDLLARRAPR